MRLRAVWAVGAALAVFSVPAHAQGFGGRGGPGGFGGGGPIGLLSIPEVQKELKLDEAQIDLLQAVRREQETRGREAFRDFQNLSPEEREKRIRAMREGQEKKIAEVLDAKQMARLRQLELQQAGLRALDRKDVADTLKLTPDQRQKVQAAIQGERDAMRAAFQGFQGNQGGDRQAQFEEIRKKMTDVRSGTEAKLNAVLTAPQKQQFQGMQGAKFQFPERRPGGPGGPGRRPGGNN